MKSKYPYSWMQLHCLYHIIVAFGLYFIFLALRHIERFIFITLLAIDANIQLNHQLISSDIEFKDNQFKDTEQVRLIGSESH